MGKPLLISDAARPVYDRLKRALVSMSIPVGLGDEFAVATLAELISDFHAKPSTAKAGAIRQLLAELGLTPASRSRLSVETPKAEADPFADLRDAE
jgi:hypothetical protein